MPKTTLDGPARKKVDSLCRLLDNEVPDPQLVELRYNAICGQLGLQFGSYRNQIVKILGKDNAAALAEMTMFEL
jgi:hypothetical protein